MKKKFNNPQNSNMKKNPKNQIKKEQKHKITPLCINKCVKWELMITYSKNKKTYLYVK